MDGNEEELLDAVHDDYAQQILSETSAEPLSAPELVERLDVSKPTVYRRLSTLQELDLVASRVEPDSGGHHRSVYVCAVDGVHIQIKPDEVSVSIDWTEEDAVDRFKTLVGDLS
jgi:predicted transcriptional regulator